MYVRDTDGPTDAVLVLLHGGGVAGWMWDAQVESFASDFRILVPDLHGHDHSVHIPFTTSAAIVADLEERLEQLPAGRDVTVAGFSLGAQIALSLACARPDLVTRLVVTSALTSGLPLAAVSRCLVSLTAPLTRVEWFAKLQAKSLFIPDNLRADYLRTSSSLTRRSLVALTTANAEFRTPPTWHTYPGDSLLLAGSEESRSLLRDMRRLHEDNPRSRLVIHDGAGHGLPLQHSDWFTTRVGDWIDSVR